MAEVEQVAKKEAPNYIALLMEEHYWLAKHKQEYAGSWVALYGTTMLAYGQDLDMVRQEAMSHRIIEKTGGMPYILRIRTPEELEVYIKERNAA